MPHDFPYDVDCAIVMSIGEDVEAWTARRDSSGRYQLTEVIIEGGASLDAAALAGLNRDGIVRHDLDAIDDAEVISWRNG